ncbi:MAG: DUF559 domain-containing protein [Sphingobacteriales bacterium]|nr:MAG: DUF559 domain-containing protein [Sphingobacteriales bacterium]
MFKFFPFRPFEEVKFSTEGLTKEFLENNNIPTKNLLFSKYHLPYNPNLKQFSRNLRNVSELAEILLWNELKADKFLGLSFNRQKPILNYIADFYCKEKGVVIEIDGASHFSEEAMQYDAERDRQMKVLGLKVIRIADKDVRKNMAGVLEELAHFLTPELTPPNPQQEITPPNPQQEITPPKRLSKKHPHCGLI